VTRPESDPVLRLLADGKRRLRRGWCKGGLARDGQGLLVMPQFQNAVRWCVVGAVYEDRAAIECVHRSAQLVGYWGGGVLNDDPRTELRHVLGLLDFAGGLRRLDLAKEPRR
jgi:hypothetical protein